HARLYGDRRLERMEAAASDVQFLSNHLSHETAFSVLGDITRQWFSQCFDEPTLAQRLAWPALKAGKNLLLCAPTGSGKTLAAFLPILDDLVSNPFTSSVRCLFVAPLKALGNDLCANLETYRRGLYQTGLRRADSLRIALRTGDTPASVRRRLL